MTRAVLSIGSNVGDRLGYLRVATEGIGPALLGVSAVYQTAPVGGVPQGDFLNAILVVAAADTDARGWLALARSLEAAAGRRRGVRWGPRTLDVDVVTVDGMISADPELTLPHPRAHERAFVLVPWQDLEPDAVLPGHGPVRDIVAGLDRGSVRRRDDLRLTGAERAQREPESPQGEREERALSEPESPQGERVATTNSRPDVRGPGIREERAQ